MKITRIRVWRKDLPLTKPYWLAGGELTVPDVPGLGVAPEIDQLGEPVAVYD